MADSAMYPSRRRFLGMAAGTAAAGALLSACGGGSSSSGSASGGSGGTMKFWDMPWGTPAYNTAGQNLVATYKPASGLPKATYQTIQWTNFTETFSSAIASNTGPAVSTGGGFQAFQYAAQGAIAYADPVIGAFQKDGTYNDFLPGQIEAMKTPNGYAAVPWQLDIRVWWYNKAVFSQLGLTPPTTWDQLLTVGQTLAKHGYYAFASGAGAGNNLGAHGMVSMMINNGGGLFNADNQLEVVTPANLEAMQFVQELAKAKIIYPASVSFTTSNQDSAWQNKQFVMGIDTVGLPSSAGSTGSDLALLQPMTSPSGNKGTLIFQNNVMMYKNAPSQAGSQAFLEWYIKHMGAYWQQNLGLALPVLKSIVALPAFQQNVNQVAAVKYWVPVAKTYASVGTVLSPKLAQVDGSQPLQNFTQTMLGGGDPKQALETLQGALSSIVK
jgi:multiple sugar transport system substrate-binding protein